MDRSRAFFWAAALVLTVFTADILIAKAQIIAGNTIPLHLPEWLQFLTLLLAVVFFVVGTLIRERQEADDDNAETAIHDDGRPDPQSAR